MARAVVRAHPLADARVVRVLLPPVVVAPVVAGVVRRVREDQVDLPALAEERHHRLEVVALDQQVARLLGVGAGRVLLDRPRDARPNAASELAGIGLAREVDVDAALAAGLQQLDELVLGKVFETSWIGERLNDVSCHRYSPTLA